MFAIMKPEYYEILFVNNLETEVYKAIYIYIYTLLI